MKLPYTPRHINVTDCEGYPVSVHSLVRRLCLATVPAGLLWLAASLPAQAEDPDFIAFSGAYFDVNHRRHDAFEGRVEYRSGHRFWLVKPFVGVMATSEGAGYGYAGILMDLYFGRRIVVTPSFAPGVYLHGSGENLGFPLEFRSQIEVSYRFDDRSRLGVSFSHMSNASLGDHNQGVESLAVTYAVPLYKIFGGL